MGDKPSAPAFCLRGVRQVRAGTVALDGVDLEIHQDRLTALVGASGAGKTSLLRLLNRLDEPLEGVIEYRRRSLDELPVRQLRRRVGFVFQTPVMFPGTVRDNLREATALADDRLHDLESAMRNAMDLAELDPELLDRQGDRLSLGKKQRANLARALMNGPEALLMDEPTSALDPETADRLMDTVRRMSMERALTVVMVTHRLAEARRFSDTTVVLDAGRVLATGPTPEVFGQTAHESVARAGAAVVGRFSDPQGERARMSTANDPAPAEIPGPPVEEAPRHAALPAVPFREAFRTWVRVGLLSFGGPAGQIAVMHRILVEEKRWVSESQFLHALNYCMLLPGPEAQQLATYIGWLLHRIRGGLVAGILFVLPGFVSILLLSILYAGFQETTLVQALFFGLKPAVVAIVVQAVLRAAILTKTATE